MCSPFRFGFDRIRIWWSKKGVRGWGGLKESFFPFHLFAVRHSNKNIHEKSKLLFFCLKLTSSLIFQGPESNSSMATPVLCGSHRVSMLGAMRLVILLGFFACSSSGLDTPSDKDVSNNFQSSSPEDYGIHLLEDSGSPTSTYAYIFPSVKSQSLLA